MSVPEFPHVSRELARSARDRFQHRYAQPLTEEDGREIVCNLLGMYNLLRQWKADDDEKAALLAAKAARRRSRKRTVPPNQE